MKMAQRTISGGAGMRRGGFTLVELLLSVFLLTIGLVGLLSIFPIGADWTRQVTEESIGQSIGRIAMGRIEASYTASDMAGVNYYDLRALPNLTGKIPASERAFQYGAAVPYPVGNPAAAMYFWTALARLSPDQTLGDGHVYDVYILVMKKGQPGDSFTTVTPPPPVTPSELLGARAGSGETYIPMVVTDSYYRSKQTNGEFYEANKRNTPQIGDMGIGKNSGTVFRQVIDYDAAAIPPVPRLITSPPIIGYFSPGNVNSSADGASNPVEAILWVPPPDPMVRPPTDTTPSPLVYVFQKKIAF
jgi:hypothetical protein